jgi:hypothetical protein
VRGGAIRQERTAFDETLGGRRRRQRGLVVVIVASATRSSTAGLCVVAAASPAIIWLRRCIRAVTASGTAGPLVGLDDGERLCIDGNAADKVALLEERIAVLLDALQRRPRGEVASERVSHRRGGN